MRFFKFITNKTTIITIGIALQLTWILVFVFLLGENSMALQTLFSVLSVLATVWILNKRSDPSVKISWIVLILLFPLFGGVIYLLTGGKRPTKRMRKKFVRGEKLVEPYIESDGQAAAALRTRLAGQCCYVERCGFPAYENTGAWFYAESEPMYASLLHELKNAKSFIFLEYYIIQEGIMWGGILDILKEKVAAGVDVRLIYDDLGSRTLPTNYPERIQGLGIRCMGFNRFVPMLAAVMNHRDHRKICVIDGITAFTGGINLADRYINIDCKYGHWKDSAVMIKGPAVKNFTLLFLEMWNSFIPIDKDISRFLPKNTEEFPSCGGFVQPYGDTPLKDEPLGENIYLNIIASAKRYVYIYTPYLVIGHSLTSALSLAAKRGVSVKIITSGVAESFLIQQQNRSHYPDLLDAGVRIFEYMPGIVHAKCMVSDDEIASVGTANLDYRSLILHFEDGCLFYKTDVPKALREDFNHMLKRCREVMNEKPRINVLLSIYQAILRLLSPLM